ncbi:MAG: hypothetical protein ACJAW3_000355 [Lentimonas sp.]|jgi:hypothetical protein
MQQDSYEIVKIRKSLRVRKLMILLCLSVLSLGILSIVFFGFEGNKQAIKFIDSKNKFKKTNKLMTGLRMRLEYEDGDFYDIKAKKALHKNQDDAQLFDVKADGSMGEITAGSLLITNNGNDLYFSDNPVLIITEIQDEQ